MSDAFISYSRLDKEFVGKLREALADKGQDIWIDWESIPASQAWWQEIRKGIAKANNFVLIMSSSSMSSPICQMEIEYAREVGKRIIPVDYTEFQRDDCLLSIAKRLADKEQSATREIWGTRQAHDLYDENVAAIKPINYFAFKWDADFTSRFEALFTVIKNDHDYKEKHTTLSLRAAEWDRRKRDASFLLLGNELTDAEKWRQESATGKEPPPTVLQTEYINASRRSANRRRNITISGVLIATAALVFAVGASLVGVNAVNQMTTATVAQGRAQNAAVTATIAQGAAVNAQGTAVAQADTAQQDAKTAKTEVAVAGITLTSVPPVLTAVASALADAKVEQDIGLKLAEASLSVVGKDYSSAVRITNALVEAYPYKALAYVSRGIIYANSGQADNAIADLTTAIKLSPNFALSYFDRGTVYAGEKQYLNAVRDLSKAIELNPDFTNAFQSRGVAYNGLELYEKAIADFSKVIKLDPKYTDAYESRGVAYSGLKRYMDAIHDFNKAIELDPNNKEAYFQRGLAYSDLPQYDDAIHDFSKAIELDPSDVRFYVNRGVVYGYQKEDAKALADYDQALELDSKSVFAHLTRGLFYIQHDETDKAFADFSTATALDPSNDRAHYWLGRIYIVDNEYDKALAELSTAIELGTQEIDVYFFRGAIYYINSQNSESVSDWKQYKALGGILAPKWEQAFVDAEAALTQTLIPTVTATAAK